MKSIIRLGGVDDAIVIPQPRTEAAGSFVGSHPRPSRRVLGRRDRVRSKELVGDVPLDREQVDRALVKIDLHPRQLVAGVSLSVVLDVGDVEEKLQLGIPIEESAGGLDRVPLDRGPQDGRVLDL